MLNSALFFGFLVAAFAVLVVPGPGVLYVVARSLNQGIMAGFVSALGLSVGVLVHVAAAVAGLSAIVLTSATAFLIVKFLGAGYLVYLGIQTLRSGRASIQSDTVTRLPLSRLFTDGVMVSVLNPKIAVFFLAFLPQFVDPALGSVSRQIVLLGLIYAGLALCTDSTYGVLAGSLKRMFHGDFLQGPLPRYISGSLLVGLGLKAALTSQQQ
ncbi:LysE family translocator [Hoeflea sp. TYP-13]|uniref:LysE family translocator n=1 Tax=Hoeflea sp. TYP-13 TaxID=3230023 RepID=UPI0034C6B82B